MTKAPDPQSELEKTPTSGPGSAAAFGTGVDPLADFEALLTVAPQSSFNIASLLSLAAARHPDQTAVLTRRRPDCLGRLKLTYAQLEDNSSTLAAALAKSELSPGDRVVVMVPPGPDFFIVIFGLFKAALVPVMVDPGMGLKRMLMCLAEGRPKGLVGVNLAHLASLIMPRFFTSIRHRVSLGRTFGWGGQSLKKILTSPPGPFALPETLAGDTAAILFTSGATGPAKGTIYTHSMFLAQVGLIRHVFGLTEGGVDLATFPLFSLFSAALGLTSVTPNMNPIKPGQADPRRLISAIDGEKATSMFASPALLTVLARHAKAENLTFRTLKRVISAGAPVRPELLAEFSQVLPPETRLLTPYGATEAMPLTTIEAGEVAQIRGMTEQGFGMCVGQPLPGHRVAIIPICDNVLESFSEAKILPKAEIGEIVAQGPVIAPSYFERPLETELSLITGPDGLIWRRLGDLGWLDAQGRLWFCGRKSQRVVTQTGVFFTVCCEAVFNNHPKVRRSALIGVGAPTNRIPVVVIEPIGRLSSSGWLTMQEELSALARSNPRTRAITIFLKKKNFPVDIRHNAKINREKLAIWAVGQLGEHLPSSRN
ncbi:MAG: AMP-binding protein [Deltaproteobacteria bacterium]|jgi:acyl-CoA synthetase (AMP-forming)/AMP-acid ligase II|nr:AMP-binding protein [Deltaproteobacteria bacterium]